MIRTNKGFTLIELLAVVAIIGFLSSIIITNVKSSKDKAKIANGLRFSDSIVRSLADGMVSYWRFDENTGTTARDSWGSNNGTINGASWTTGIIGKALSFDGNDYVQISANSITNNLMTISFWINNNATIGVLFMNRQVWNGNSGIEIWVDGNSKINVRGAGPQSFVSNLTYNGGWVHAVIIFNNTNASIYRNGVFDESGNVGAVTSSSYDFLIGIYGDKFSAGFNGKIDEVQIYSQALTVVEIQKLYAEGAKKHGLVVSNF